MSNKGFGKFLVGIGIGAAAGMLLAPESGDETRKKLKKKIDKLLKEIEDLDYNEAKDNLVKKVGDLEKEIEDLNKEKVVTLAKDKAEKVKKKADQIYKEAVKQGKPAIEKAAKEVKTQTATVLKTVADKLEDK